MYGKIIALIALAAIAAAEPCGITGGYISTGMSGYGLGGCRSRVLNVGCSTPVVSTFPACAPIATPTCVVDPIPTTIASGVVGAGVCGAGYGSGLYGAGLYGSGVYGGYGYGSSCGGFGGCGTNILPTVC